MDSTEIVVFITLSIFTISLMNLLRWFFSPVLLSLEYGKFHYNDIYYVTEKNKKEKFNTIDQKETIYMSLIVPAYNEQDRMSIMLEETIAYCESRKDWNINNLKPYEIVIVDDGSKDNTSEIGLKYVKKYGSDKIRVLTLDKNSGKGGALQIGMLHGRGKYLLMVDADGASKISDLINLEKGLNSIINNDHGIAVGSRAHLQENAVAQRAWYRNFLMYIFHFLVAFFAVRGIKDTQCGFKLFTRKTASILFKNLNLKRWCFDVEILYMANLLKIPIKEVAINWQEIEGSKLSILDSSLTMARDLILIKFCYLFGIWSIDNANLSSTVENTSPALKSKKDE